MLPTWSPDFPPACAGGDPPPPVPPSRYVILRGLSQLRYALLVRPSFRPLPPGESIGVVALSGPVDAERLDRGLAVLRSWGHPVMEAPNLRRRGPREYLAGEDGERLGGLLELLDRGVRHFVAARGGYGCMRLLEHLPWERLTGGGVTFAGYSDLTPLLNALAGRGVVQVHGPMVSGGLGGPESAGRLRNFLEGGLTGGELFRFPPASVVVPGRAEGVVAGGNLSMICAVLGTPWEVRLEGTLLMLEDVGEPLYRIDRMLTQLRLSGRLGGVKALIWGDLDEARMSREEFGQLLAAAAPGVPVVLGLPFGHGQRNLAFPIGARAELDTGRGSIFWRV